MVVPGLNWLGVLLSGTGSPPVLAAMRWWTNRGERAEEKRDVELSLLEKCSAAWAKAVLHVFDRGFAGAPWLEALARTETRFVMRWKKRNHLQDVLGEEAPAWMLVRGKKTRQSRMVAGLGGQRSRRGVLSVPVRHPAFPGSLWLVVSRRGKGHEPWYLLPNELADTPAAMWKIVFAYARRWQIEMAWRFGKTELAMQSPRLWSWDNRLKLLLIVSLAYAFLLSLLDPLLISNHCETSSSNASATEQESGAGNPRLRFIVSVSPSATSGSPPHHPSWRFAKIRDDSCCNLQR